MRPIVMRLRYLISCIMYKSNIIDREQWCLGSGSCSGSLTGWFATRHREARWRGNSDDGVGYFGQGIESVKEIEEIGDSDDQFTYISS